MLGSWNEEVTENVKRATDEIGEELKQEISSKSPVGRRGKYSKLWKLKKISRGEKYSIAVYSTEAGLTHLLEYGHAIRNGTGRTYGKTKAQPHILSTREAAANKLEKAIEEAINNASR